MSASVKFYVADVVYHVLSLGRLIPTGYMFSFGQHERYMANDGVRAKTYPKGKALVLRVRRRRSLLHRVKLQQTDHVREVYAVRRCTQRPGGAEVRAYRLAHCSYADGGAVCA